MEGHEDIRAAIRDHLMAQLPAQLAALRARKGVTTPREPVAYLLADTLRVLAKYPCVLIRSTSAGPIVDAGDGVYVARYKVEVVVAAEVTTAGAYESASADRDRLSLAVRWALLTPASTLPPEVTLALSDLTEDHGPAAETEVGRPLAVGVTTLYAVVTETAPDAEQVAEVGGPPVPESIGAVDFATVAHSADQTI